jgi:hypothetical protein
MASLTSVSNVKTLLDDFQHAIDVAKLAGTDITQNETLTEKSDRCAAAILQLPNGRASDSLSDEWTRLNDKIDPNSINNRLTRSFALAPSPYAPISMKQIQAWVSSMPTTQK